MDLPVAHPATYFGKIRSINQILQDETTLPEMKTFLAPILAKEGPSGNVPYFRKKDFPKPNPKHGQFFNVFIQNLREICSYPRDETYVKNLLINMCTAVGLNDPSHGLIARVETKILAELPNDLEMKARPEIVVGKIREHTELFHFLGSEAKKLKIPSRRRGEAQVVAELICAILVNYLTTGEVVPLVNMYVNGVYVRFVTVKVPKR
eukprot:Phypoly_transcript_11330.p1 GENE.Phypoly_transcript_11330~~Phypoly_transcript_11330.p1  ORF type:complete len:207 (+),score=8.91 Phypoly_transcript_11330:218-838(+)